MLVKYLHSSDQYRVVSNKIKGSSLPFIKEGGCCIASDMAYANSTSAIASLSASCSAPILCTRSAFLLGPGMIRLRVEVGGVKLTSSASGSVSVPTTLTCLLSAAGWRAVRTTVVSASPTAWQTEYPASFTSVFRRLIRQDLF